MALFPLHLNLCSASPIKSEHLDLTVSLQVIVCLFFFTLLHIHKQHETEQQQQKQNGRKNLTNKNTFKRKSGEKMTREKKRY